MSEYNFHLVIRFRLVIPRYFLFQLPDFLQIFLSVSHLSYRLYPIIVKNLYTTSIIEHSRLPAVDRLHTLHYNMAIIVSRTIYEKSPKDKDYFQVRRTNS